MTAATASMEGIGVERDARRSRALLQAWLLCVVFLLFALVMVGGATRLTDSGLSITEWKPIHGVVPPLSEADWQEEFAKYREIPEYRIINPDMTLDGFKTIFWWEWTHRALARSIGVVFALPLLFFWVTGRVERQLKPKLLGILALGGLQGAIGWWMVASGLAVRTDVSQYRLATHLTTAALIIAATVTVARGLSPAKEVPAARSTQRFAGLLVLAALAQIYLGGLVAGLDAGLSYNTWPLMDGSLVPRSLFAIEPAWRNFFENPKLVQFDHRLGAYTLFALTLGYMITVLRSRPASAHARRAVTLFFLVTLQACLGIATLIWQVPLNWALAHQFTALLVLSYAASQWRAAKGSYPLEAQAA